MLNRVVLVGRLTKDPEFRTTPSGVDVATFTLAVNRNFKSKNGEQQADFINCVAFGRQGEFAEKYLKQGTKIVISGRIQTGSYTNRDGVKVYTTDVVVEEQDFAESKAFASGNETDGRPAAAGSLPEKEETAENQTPSQDGFMTIPEGIEDELPFI